MKKYVLLSAALMLSIMLSAQTQQGYVKTKGRMVNNQLVPGQGLKGATVSIKGRTAVLVQSDDGAFSFPIPEAQFRVDSVRKKGYQLVDMDALSKTYKHSANPIYLVMETPEQQLQDQLAAERKIRRTLTRQLHQREDEIEALKEQQKISEEEYRQALQKLYEETDQNEQLVKDMVERYSKIDYDQLSEFDQKISELILNGELTKADSMLRTKGDINERVEEYQKHKAINAKEKEELSQRQEQLEQSELLAQKELEDLANDCYRKFEIHKMKHENDSAAYFIELRAGLDTTNTEWIYDAGVFAYEYSSDYTKALYYFQLGLRQYQLTTGENVKKASYYQAIGVMYCYMDNTDEAIKYCNKALLIRQSILGEKHHDVASSYNAIGFVYEQRNDYTTALEYFHKALSILESSFDKTDPMVATAYNNTGTAYGYLGDYENSVIYLNKALIICRTIYGEDNFTVGGYYNNLGVVFARQGHIEKALEYISKAATILENTLGKYHLTISSAYNNMGHLAGRQGNYEKAFEYLNEALIISETILGESHPEVAYPLNNIASLYSALGNYDNAIEYFHKALAIFKTAYGENNDKTAVCYDNLGDVYRGMKNYEKAKEYYNKALSAQISSLGENHPDLCMSYIRIGAIYNDEGDYDKALGYFYKGLTIGKSVFGENHPDIANSYFWIGHVFIKMGNYETALEYCNKALSIWERTSDPDHQIKIAKDTISEIQSKLKEQENQPNE